MKKEKACGTIIIDNNKVLLIQQKQGFYGFPKGHVEGNETEVETAIRETKEETNLDVVVDESKRFEISYIVNDNIDKNVVYFLAKLTGENKVVAQVEEINEVLWVDIDKAEDILTFDNLKELWKEVLKEVR